MTGGNGDGAGEFQESCEADAESRGAGVGHLHFGQDLANLAGGSEEVGQTTLAAPDFDGVVGRVGIGDEQAFDAFAEQALGGVRRAVGIDAEDGDVVVAGIPDDHVFPVFAPVGFIGVDDVAVAHFLHQILIERFAVVAGAFFKSEGAGGNEIQSEERAHHLLDFPVGQLDLVAQIEGGGFGGGADGSEGQPAFGFCKHLPATSGAIGGLVDVGGDEGLRAQHDVFLEIGGGAAA